MSPAWQRILPVLVSIGIIIAVAILRQSSKTFAAIAATMPINIPLAMWILYSGAPDDRDSLLRALETMIVSFPTGLAFLIVAYLAAKAGWGLVPILLAGYAAWGIALVILLQLRGVLFGS